MYNKIERCFCSVYGRDFSCRINTDKRCRIYLCVDATVITTQLHSDLCKSIIPAFRLSCLTARPPSLILSDVVCTHLSLILLSLSQLRLEISRRLSAGNTSSIITTFLTRWPSWTRSWSSTINMCKCIMKILSHLNTRKYRVFQKM